jgi:hypothetical protein
MCPTKERNLTVSGTDEKNQLQRRFSSGDSVPRPLGFIASMPIPANDVCS